jgi:hypothetical protein
VRDDLDCDGREEVIDTFRWALEERRDADALEFIRSGEHVVMGARGSRLTELGGRDGRIVRIDDYRRRSEALAAAGIAADAGWR